MAAYSLNLAPRKTIGASEARKAETIRVTGKSGHRVAGIEAIDQQSAGLRESWHSVIAANDKAHRPPLEQGAGSESSVR